MAEPVATDFSKGEVARETINTWVENQTNSKIKDLIAKNVLNGLTNYQPYEAYNHHIRNNPKRSISQIKVLNQLALLTFEAKQIDDPVCVKTDYSEPTESDLEIIFSDFYGTNINGFEGTFLFEKKSLA